MLFIASVTVNASTVIWRHSFDEQAVIHYGGKTYSITEYAENHLGDSLFNVAYMIRDTTNDSYFNFQFPWGPEDVNWVDNNGAGGREYVIDQPAIVGNVEVDGSRAIWSTFDGSWDNGMVVELSLYNEDSNTFQLFAISDVFTLSDVRRGVWAEGTVDPLLQITTLTDFYAIDSPVPEPSMAMMLLIGASVLLLRRKNG